MKNDQWTPGELQAIDSLFNALVTVGETLPDVHDQTRQFWLESGDLLARGSEAGHPERRAEYALLEVFQLEYMKRSIRLLQIPKVFLQRNRHFDATTRLAAVRAPQEIDEATVKRLFDNDTIEMVLSDNRVIVSYLPRLKLIQSSGGIAAIAPVFYARDIFAAYLGRATTATSVLEVSFAILKTVAIDLLGKNNPILGPAVALAEALTDIEERRLRQFTQGVEERDRFLNLQDAVNGGHQMLTDAENLIANCISLNEQADAEFDLAVTRMGKVADIVAKL